MAQEALGRVPERYTARSPWRIAPRFNVSSSALQIIDLCAVVVLAWLVPSLIAGDKVLSFWGPVLGVLQVLSCKRMGYYASWPATDQREKYKILLKGSILAEALVMTSLFVLHRDSPRPAALLWVAAVSGTWLLTTLRFRRGGSSHWSQTAPHARRNTLIIGYSEVGKALADFLQTNPSYGCDIAGFLDDHAHGSQILGTTADLERTIRANFIDQVYITSYSNRELVKALTLRAPSLGVDVSIVPDLFDGIGWNVPVDSVGHFPVLVLHRAQAYPLQRALKRAIDIVGSTAGLIISAPLLVVVAICIKLDSPGPVLYKSSRVGRKGKTFACYKFRSMSDGAAEQLCALSHLNERKGPLFKISNDPRVTRVGRWIRKYSIDELPQLINVLRGEMSLVGPRPPAVEEYRRFKLQHLRKLDVIPGITGLWQVTSRSDPSFQSYIRCDLEYIENWSLWLDFEIIAWTAIEVLRGSGV